MQGRQFIPISDLTERRIAEVGKQGGDGGWVTIGVLAETTPVRTGPSGGKFVIWTLTDLKGAAPTSVSVFLFKDACSSLDGSALGVGSVFVVFNAAAMPGREKSKFSLSVSQDFQLTKIGDAIDFGVCSGEKKGGGKCGVIVNTSVVRVTPLQPLLHTNRAFPSSYRPSCNLSSARCTKDTRY